MSRKTFREFYAERHGAYPGAAGEHYHGIFARLCDAFAAFVDEALADSGGGRPRCLDKNEEAALIVMKRSGAADKEIMARFDIGRQTIYDIMARAGESCTETVSVQDSACAHTEAGCSMENVQDMPKRGDP